MNETYKNYIIIALLLACVAFGWILFRDISDNSRTITNLRTELDQVRQHQQDTTTRLITIEQGLNRSIVRTEVVTERVETVKDRIADGTEQLEASQRIIESSKSILEAVRATGKETEKK